MWILHDRDLGALSTEKNSPYAIVGGVVFGPDQSGYHGGHGDHGRFTDGERGRE